MDTTETRRMKAHSTEELKKIRDALASMDFGGDIYRAVTDELERKVKANSRVEEIDAWKCSQCSELHEDKDDAVDCCNSVEEVTAYKCTECDALYEGEDEAKECCDC